MDLSQEGWQAPPLSPQEGLPFSFQSAFGLQKPSPTGEGAGPSPFVMNKHGANLQQSIALPPETKRIIHIFVSEKESFIETPCGGHHDPGDQKAETIEKRDLLHPS
jgi:hypothetical protein